MQCHKISHELPDVVVPYKRYESASMEGALMEQTLPEADCCPAELSTIQRWKLWFFLLSVKCYNKVVTGVANKL
jgi:hypothetical protein